MATTTGPVTGPTQNVIAALIHVQLGQTLRDVFAGKDGVFDGIANPFSSSAGTLLEQLQEPQDDPPRLSLRLVLNIVPDLLPEGSEAMRAGTSLITRVRERLRAMPQHVDRFLELAMADDPAAIQRANDALLSGMEERWSSLKTFIRRDDVGTILSFATMASAIQGLGANLADVPEEMEKALLDYFFRAGGYLTVEGERIIAPVHLANLVTAGSAAAAGPLAGPAGLQAVKGLFTRATAEQYIRDISRLIVESAYDAVRGLRSTCGKVKEGLARSPGRNSSAAIVQKFEAWLRGCSAMAESGAMRAVETGTQGVSQLQTNPLIAAAAGSFAGTVARKLSQDAFLAVLRKDLGL